MTKRAFLTLFAGFMTVSSALWAVERPVAIRGVRPLGMGDAFTAMADDQNVFFYNPAGTIQRVGGMMTLLEIPVTIGKDFQDVYDFISDNEDDLSNFDNLPEARQTALINTIEATLTQLNPSIGLGFPNTSYVSGPSEGHFHWGFGLFGQTQGSFRINNGILAPTLDYDINTDLVPMINLAKGFNDGKWGVGINLKYIHRVQVKEERVSFLQLEDFDEPLVQRGRGFGLDLGFMSRPNDRWRFGVSALDIFGTSLDFDFAEGEDGFTAKQGGKRSIPQRWNLGAAWIPSLIGLGPIGMDTGNRFRFAVDVKDVLNAKNKVFFDNGLLADTAWTHVHFGAEYSWWFLRLRAGGNQGYATVGFGVVIPLLKFDYAYFSDERSRFAGGLKQTNHMLSLALRWGGDRTVSHEKINEKPSAGPPMSSEPEPSSETSQ